MMGSPDVAGPGEGKGVEMREWKRRAETLFTWLWRVGAAACSSVKWRFLKKEASLGVLRIK